MTLSRFRTLATLAAALVISAGVVALTLTPLPRTHEEIQWGLNVQNVNAQNPTNSRLQADSAALNHKAQVVGTYQDWGCPGSWTPLDPSGYVRDILAAGATPQISWYPNDSCVTLRDIASGPYDSYFKSYAAAAATLPGKPTIYLRPFEEFDNTGYHWSYENWSSPRAFIEAWRHIYDIFRTEGANNVQFVFNWGTSTNDTQRFLDSHYPGSRYVDWLSWDQYGSANVAGNYNIAQSIDPSKLIQIDEAGGLDSSYQALQDLMNGLADGSFPKIKEVTLFDSTGSGQDYTLTTNPTVKAYVAGMLMYGAFRKGNVRPTGY